LNKKTNKAKRKYRQDEAKKSTQKMLRNRDPMRPFKFCIFCPQKNQARCRCPKKTEIQFQQKLIATGAFCKTP